MTFRNEPSLERWLAALEAPGPRTITWEFPNDHLRDEYLDTISRRSDEEVRALLRHLLIESGSLGIDEHRLESMRFWKENAEAIEAAGLPTPSGGESEYVRRLLAAAEDESAAPPWPGLTWVLDLLPQKPMEAIGAIESYLSAHLMVLPDGRINGLSDAQAVIRGATKRILITTSTFTRPARHEVAERPQLELIDWDELLPLLDEHLGADWHHLLARYVAHSRRRHAA